MTNPTTLSWQVYDPAGRRKYLSVEESTRFLRAADRRAPYCRALCYVLAFTGCRISEALALRPPQVDAEQGKVQFRTLKRRKTQFRTVPVPPHVVAMLLTLPVGSDGRFWTIHRATAWRQVKAVMEAAEIDGVRSCPKGLRHGFGMRATMHSIPSNIIQRWMGHASGTTTAIYLDAVGVEERSFARRMW